VPDSNISVAFDMTFPNRNQAGSGSYARSLVAALEARADIETSVVSAPDGTNFAGTIRWLVRDAGEKLSTNRTSLLHCPTFVTPWNVPVPFVTTVLDLSTRRFPSDYPLEWRTRRDVIAEYGVRPEKVLTIHPGIDQIFFDAEPAATRPGPPHLLFPGAPIARKNLELVLHALASAPAGTATAGVDLDISGANEAAFPNHAALIRSLGLRERVHWLGQVSRADMPALMAAAAAVVYPSHYEGFGLPPLEAMAAGCPVVASTASCLPEVLGDAALLVDPSNETGFARAVESVLTDQQVRERLIAAGRAQARRFTWERCAERTVDAYRLALQVAA